MFGLRGILQGMAMLEDAGDATCAGAEHGRIGVAEICVETCLMRSLVVPAWWLTITYVAQPSFPR
jgi:hypothetical protein